MFTSEEGSTRRLIELSIGYFLFYIVTGIMVKYFVGGLRQPPMAQMGYLFNNTLGGSAVALGVVLALGWVKIKSNQTVPFAGFRIPVELRYIVPSGVCTAVIIPTTTLMYTLPISVLVAMVIMRGSVIVISRCVDAIQIGQGILRKKVYAEENWGVVFAILAVATNVLLIPVVTWLDAKGMNASAALGLSGASMKGSFDFLTNAAAMTIMGMYIVAYSIRIYIMNYYKNTRAQGVPQDNKGFFALEQIAASGTMVIAAAVFLFGPFDASDVRIADFRAAAQAPDLMAVLSGVPFGIVAFFSVFIFMFKGRTATFAGLVNRLVSLMAGTAATLILFWFFGQKAPKMQDWVSLGFILVAVYFLSRAEKKRAAELAAQKG